MSEQDHYTLVKILERDVAALKEQLKQIETRDHSKQDAADLAVLKQRVEQMEEDIKELAALQSATYVPMSRYLPVEKVVFGQVGFILIAFIGALVSLVIRS